MSGCFTAHLSRRVAPVAQGADVMISMQQFALVLGFGLASFFGLASKAYADDPSLPPIVVRQPHYGTPDSAAPIVHPEWGQEIDIIPADGDGDGVIDADDACPVVWGIKSEDPKTNGCPLDPNTDSDGDGIRNSDDACPLVAGIKTDNPKTNGCPGSATSRSDYFGARLRAGLSVTSLVYEDGLVNGAGGIAFELGYKKWWLAGHLVGGGGPHERAGLIDGGVGPMWRVTPRLALGFKGNLDFWIYRFKARGNESHSRVIRGGLTGVGSVDIIDHLQAMLAVGGDIVSVETIDDVPVTSGVRVMVSLNLLAGRR